MMKTAILKSENGFAMTEAAVFMFTFILFLAYSIDFFSIIHTGIVNSTAARTYIFETLEHRSNINFLRQGDETDGSDQNPSVYYGKMHMRLHAVSAEDQDPSDKNGAQAPARLLTLTDGQSQWADRGNLNSQQNQAGTVYVRSGYGICLDAQCP